MRDYSFGNFIGTLRMRKGLSQYQLGVLVGVSDKAVSKWENGASKPRINTIRKLAQVFELSVDELLTCEYATFSRDRKDLFAMKRNIIKLAEEKMKEIYGDKPPIRINNRFKFEQLMIEENGILLWMGFMGKLQEMFNNDDLSFEVRTAQIGASFIAWLLGGTDVNPLPAHYYCPNCKKIEFVDGEQCGLDLPDKQCTCGEKYHKDGFNIEAMNMYPLGKWYDIDVSKDGTEVTKRCLEKYFHEYGLIRKIEFIGDEDRIQEEQNKLKISRFILVSKEMEKHFPTEKIEVTLSKYFDILHDVSGITVIENKENNLEKNKINIDFLQKEIELFYKYAIKNNVFKEQLFNIDLSSIFSTLKNPKFSDVLAIFGFVHGTGTWKDNAEILYAEGIPLNEMIFCREDVYGYLYKKMKEKGFDDPCGLVYEIKEKVRRGKYHNGHMSEDIKDILLECDVPQWYVESMQKIQYLFPKSYLVILLKREMNKYINNNQEI